MLITLTNDFHNTSRTVRVPADGYISAATARRIRNDLCGISGCICGGVLGQRMSTHTADGKQIIIDNDYRFASNGKGAQIKIA